MKVSWEEISLLGLGVGRGARVRERKEISGRGNSVCKNKTPWEWGFLSVHYFIPWTKNRAVPSGVRLEIEPGLRYVDAQRFPLLRAPGPHHQETSQELVSDLKQPITMLRVTTMNKQKSLPYGSGTAVWRETINKINKVNQQTVLYIRRWWV